MFGTLIVLSLTITNLVAIRVNYKLYQELKTDILERRFDNYFKETEIDINETIV